MFEGKFKTPESIEEARQRRTSLTIDSLSIEAQLGDKSPKMADDGHRMNIMEYHDWRRKASYALTIKRAEMIFLRDWIRDNPENKVEGGLFRAVREFIVHQDERSFQILTDAYNQMAAFRGAKPILDEVTA